MIRARAKKGKEIKKDILIIWERNDYANVLAKKIGNAVTVTSRDELSKSDLTADRYSSAIVLVELRWFSDSPFDGIELVKQKLRASLKLQFPILFVSFATPADILLNDEGNSNLNNLIASTIGHDFLQLPVSPRTLLDHLDTLEPLSDIQLADVVYHACDLIGLVRTQIHKFQGQIGSVEKKSSRVIIEREFIQCLDEITTLIGNPASEPAFYRMKSELKAKLSDGKVSMAWMQDFWTRCGAELLSMARQVNDPLSGADEHILDAKTIEPWKVLILDDEPFSRHALEGAIKARGGSCVSAATVDEAKEIIDNDCFNEIAVAVADYRLLETSHGLKKQQRQQGYDFLIWLGSQDRFVRLIALSGMDRRFLLHSFRKYEVKVGVFSKQDLTSTGAMESLLDNIFDGGRENYQAVCSRPAVGFWKDLRPFYTEHRSASDYLTKEKHISARAESFVREYEELLESGDERALLNPYIKDLDGLSTALSKARPQTPDLLAAFTNKLIARRVAILLNINLGLERDAIFAVLKGYVAPGELLAEYEIKVGEELRAKNLAWEQVTNKALNKLETNSKSLVTSHLCLSFPLSLHELLVEEKEWLRSSIGVDKLDGRVTKFRHIPYLVQIAVERFLEYERAIEKKIVRDKSLFTKKGKLVLPGMAHAERILCLIKNVAVTGPSKSRFDRMLDLIVENVESQIAPSSSKDRFLLSLKENWSKDVNDRSA